MEAKHHNRFSRGTKVNLKGILTLDKNGNEKTSSITAILEDDIDLDISTNFGSFWDVSDSKLLTTLSSLMSGVMGAGHGYTHHFKQMGYQVWKGTEPIGINLTLDFFREGDASEMRNDIQMLLSVPLPGETGSGNLITPGPSILEAIKADKSESTEISRGGLINITIGGDENGSGGITFENCIMTKADPTYSKYVDESGYPIWCKIACSFVTAFTGTKNNTYTL